MYKGSTNRVASVALMVKFVLVLSGAVKVTLVLLLNVKDHVPSGPAALVLSTINDVFQLLGWLTLYWNVPVALPSEFPPTYKAATSDESQSMSSSWCESVIPARGIRNI